MIPCDEIPIFKSNISTFQETSKDTDGEVPSCMTDSHVNVINFDKVKECYIKGMELSKIPCSNDVLYINRSGHFYFVEFKNGEMKKEKIFNVYNKIYDSLLIFNDIIGENISFCRNHVTFILVYNESKNPDGNNHVKNEDCSKAEIAKHFFKKAKKKYVRFDLERFHKIYFHEVFTYTEKEFADLFLADIEKEEKEGLISNGAV